MKTIEKNIPAPETETRGRPPQWPFSTMNVGDSVFYGDDESPGKAQRYAHVHARQSGRKVKTKAELGGVRIWRIA